MSNRDLIKLYKWITSLENRIAYLESIDKPYDAISEGVAQIEINNDVLVNGFVMQEGAFAHIYVFAGAAAQNIPDNAWTKITGFTANGQSSNCSALAGSDKITVTQPGRYLVTWYCGGFPASTTNFQFSIYVNGAITVLRTVAAASGINVRTQYSISGIIDVTAANQDVEVYVYQNSGGAVNFTPVHMGLTVLYIGET